jgi:hypothetical protein
MLTTINLMSVLEIAEPALCVFAIVSIMRARATREYRYLIALLAIKSASWLLGWGWLSYAHRILTWPVVYAAYFPFFWTVFAVESILMLTVICSMYRLAMAPLKGLHNLGMLVFKWVAGVSLLVAMGAAFAPHITKLNYLVAFVSQLQRSQSILILCLLVFVCFAIRPMGLTYRSRIFGISLGLGVMATTNMIQSTWISSVSDMYGAFTLISSIAACLTLLTWTIYFAVPEPKRRLITLPTTSPFLRWNQISEVLGDDPGHVAIAGLPPEMLAPAEIEIMRRASIKMKTSWASPGQITDAA